jgi:hypothetical protein
MNWILVYALSILFVLVSSPTASAQLLARDGPIVYGHHHLK